ncbi:hypothetical protein AZE42_06295 [Rhizopogon vesiculosus]|uniref:Uncharacterized protein n=1 Tax=Rhizopogon vesiculosus TaxID=180088 RepID=A0A1J8PLT9_9AGAM|nr:hypothetical protein AZE42_06295 [Rhizopogon vesiculosus]
MYLDELQEQLLATISRAIRKLVMIHKCISKTTAERDEFCGNLAGCIWDIPAEYFIWLDESSVDDKTHQKTRGWANIGSLFRPPGAVVR